MYHLTNGIVADKTFTLSVRFHSLVNNRNILMPRTQIHSGARIWRLVIFCTPMLRYDEHKYLPCWTLLSKQKVKIYSV